MILIKVNAMNSITFNSARYRKVFRKFTFYLALYIIIPSSFFIAIEIVLRISEYGYPSGFFVKEKVGGKECYVNNYKFSWRFFPKSMARLSASVVVPVQKEKGAFRVFVFGESAAMGDPDPAFSFSRMLQVMLEKKYPDKKIEIYNTAITAINSHVLLPIVKDCLKLEPDLFVVYTGNNEVIGPYGLSAALSPFLSHRFLIKAKIALDQTKTGQWLAALSSPDQANQQEWLGMEMFMKNSVRYNDADLNTIYENFRLNLNEICNTTTSAGVKIILSTVITNVSDCSPFLSLHPATFSSDSLKRWQTYFDKGVSLMDSGYHKKAIDQYVKAYQLDDEHAELNFRLAKCYQKIGKQEKANDFFLKAQDFDALRFRADSRLNEIIKQVADTYAGKGVSLADAKVFSDQQRPGLLAGNDLLYEHVHLNLRGNFSLANCILPHVERLLNLQIPMDVVDLPSCKLRLAYSSFDEMRINEINLGRIKSLPFTYQYSNKEEVKALQDSIEHSRQKWDSLFKVSTNEYYVQAVAHHPQDWFIHLNYLRFLHYSESYAMAAQEAVALYELLPFEYLSSVNMGITHMGLKEYDKAQEYFEKAVAINPYFSEAYRNLSLLQEEQFIFYKAAHYLQKARASTQSQSVLYNRAGVYFAKDKKLDSAMIYFAKAISLNPGFTEARQNYTRVTKMKEQKLVPPAVTSFSEEYNKANAYFREGNYKAAIDFYQKALRTTPSFPNAHNNIGICYIQLHKYEEAKKHFSEAIKIDPDFYDAYPNLSTLLNQMGQYAEAIKVIDKALSIKQDPDLFHTMADAYFQLGDKASAMKYLELEKRSRKPGS